MPCPPASAFGPGSAFPLGASVTGDAVNFAVHAPRATAVRLLLFTGPEDPAPAAIHTLDPAANRTGPYWHVRVDACGHGQVYGWQVDGPRDPAISAHWRNRPAPAARRT